MIDALICKLTDENPAKRLIDFSAIQLELSIITGDASDEKKKETIYYGNVKFFARDKGFGYVTCNGQDYRVDLSRMEYIPSGYGDQAGQAVAFTANMSSKGNLFVKEFVKPKPQLKWPILEKNVNSVPTPTPTPKPQPTPTPKPQPIPTPRPQPTPTPRPQPTPTPQPAPIPRPGVPKKKGIFAWLFGK